MFEQAKEILQKTAQYTGQQSGPLSMQFFWKPETGVQVCEIAGRFFGYEHELTEYAGNFSIEKLLLDYVYDEEQIDQTFAAYSPYFDKVSAVLYFHGKPGMRVVNQEKARELEKLPGVKECWLFYQEGEQVIEHGPNPYVARYYITGDTREEVDSLTKDIFAQMTVTDEDEREVLYQNQIGK